MVRGLGFRGLGFRGCRLQEQRRLLAARQGRRVYPQQHPAPVPLGQDCPDIPSRDDVALPHSGVLSNSVVRRPFDGRQAAYRHKADRLGFGSTS